MKVESLKLKIDDIRKNLFKKLDETEIKMKK